MQPTNNSKNGAHRATSEKIAPAQADRLLNFRQVNELIGSSCRTGHTARALAARGQIRCVRLNERCLRYSEASVLALIAGRAAEAQPEPTSEQLLDRAMAKLCAEFPSKADLDLELELLAISLRTDITEDQKIYVAQEARRAHATRKEVSA